LALLKEGEVLQQKASSPDDINKAAEKFEGALRVFEAVKYEKGIGEANNNLGLLYSATSHHEEATKYYDKALSVFRRTSDPLNYAVTMNNVGLVHQAKADYREALRCFNEALTKFKAQEFARGEAYTLCNIGKILLDQGDLSKSIECFESAAEIFNRSDDERGRAKCLLGTAFVHEARGRYPEALFSCKNAQLAFHNASDVAGQVQALVLTGRLSREQGELQEADQLLLSARALTEKLGVPGLKASSAVAIGNIYERYGFFEGALSQYEIAAEIQRQIGDRRFLSNTLFDMANIHTRRGDGVRAEKEYTEVLQLKKQLGIPPTEALCQFALFYMERERYAPSDGTPDSARESNLRLAGEYIKQAEDTIQPEEKNILMLLRYVKGRYLLERDAAAALREFSNLRSQADAAGSLRCSFLASVGLGLVYEKMENWAEAEKGFEEAANVSEKIRDALDQAPKRTFLHGEEILGVKHVLPYEGLARVRLRMGKAAKSLSAAEFIKARSFADKMVTKDLGIDVGVDKKLLSDLEMVEGQIASTHRQLQDCLARGGDATAILALEKRQKELHARVEQIKRTLSQKYPDYYARRFPKPVSPEKSALKPDEIVIAYTVTDLGLLIYLIKGKSVVHAEYREVPKRELDGMVSKFLAPFERLTAENAWEKLKSFNFTMGKKLYDLLLSPVLSRIDQDKPVVIVPDGSLTQLPFEMLLADKGKIDLRDDYPSVTGTQFFADRNNVSYSPSITALTLARGLKKRTDGAPGRVLVIANPVIAAAREPAVAENVSKERADAIDRAVEQESLSQKKAAAAKEGDQRLLSVETYNKLLGFDELPEIKALTQDLLKMFGSRCDVYSGKDATMEIFSREIVPKIETYDKIVFATHGYFGDGLLPEVQEPVLLFSMIPARANNLLRMSQVMNLKLNADIVVLLAGQTGVGKYVFGEGTISMGRAFQYAGARSVLMTLWDVVEDSSVKLVFSFMTHLYEGKSKVEALRLARTELRARGYNHPFFWAPFILSGDAD